MVGGGQILASERAPLGGGVLAVISSRGGGHLVSRGGRGVLALDELHTGGGDGARKVAAFFPVCEHYFCNGQAVGCLDALGGDCQASSAKQAAGGVGGAVALGVVFHIVGGDGLGGGAKFGRPLESGGGGVLMTISSRGGGGRLALCRLAHWLGGGVLMVISSRGGGCRLALALADDLGGGRGGGVGVLMTISSRGGGHQFAGLGQQVAGLAVGQYVART